MGDSSKFQGKQNRREDDEENREPQILDSKPRGLWQQLDGRESPVQRQRPRGMWDLINERASEPVQRKAGEGAPSEPGAIASAGVQSASEPLPHHDQIQASFGRHDISGIRAQTGGAAAEASRGLGATAYAVGDRVGFAQSPDLHTAAHEAAHVVQQRGGVQLKGGIDGGAGDPHEQHADAVADRVVRGESAEGLLDVMGPAKSGASLSTAAVQRKEAKDTTGGERTTTNHDFVRENFLKLIGAIMERVQATPLTQPHPRLGWRSDRAKEYIALAISEHLRAADPNVGLARMSQLVYPANLEAIIDRVRRGPQGSRFDEVSIALGAAFDRPLISSIARMGTRAVVQWDENNGKPVHPSALVVSSPLDRVIGELLVQPEVVVYKAKGKGDDTGGKPFQKPLQMVSGEWQGAKDEKLWNWIKVTSPRNATVEDVANTFAGEYGSAQEAYRFAASPPYFGLPVDIALHTDGAREHAPADAGAKPTHPDAVVVAAPDALAKSGQSDDAAQAQAPAAGQGDKPAPDSLKRIEVQLGFIDTTVSPWGANGLLAGAEEFVARRHREFEADKKKSTQWTNVLSQQEKTLFATSSELTAFLDDLAKTGATPKDKAALGPVMRVIEAYVRAAAVSHLAAQGNAALIEARRAKALLPLELAEQQINVARSSVADQRVQEKDVTDLEPNSAANPPAIGDQMQRAADLQLAAAHGGRIDPDSVEELEVDASETALRAKLVSLATKAHSVMRKADTVGVPQGKSPYGSWSVHMVCEDMLKKINGSAGQPNTDKNDHIAGGWHAMLDSAHTLSVSAKDAKAGKSQILGERRAAIQRVSGLLATYKDQLDLEAFLKWAYQDISDAMLRSLLKDMAIQIGVAVVTGEIIGAGFAAVRGIALAGEIGSEIREAGLLYKGAEILTTAAANTGVQGAMGGEMNRQALAENALAMVLTSAALRPFQGLLHDSAAVEGEIRTWGQGAGRVGKVAAELVIDTGASIGAAGVAHAVTHGGQMDEQSAQSWVTMGLTIATQKFVHQRTQAMQHRIVEVTRELATKDPGLDALLKKSIALEQRSNSKADKVSAEEAIGLLVERRMLLVEERELYAKNPKAAKQLVDTKADLDKTGAQFMEVPLQLSHLSPVVDGHVYEGTSERIKAAFDAADRMGVPMEREWIQTEAKWRLKDGGRVIEVYERGSHNEEHVGAAAAVEGSNFVGQAKGRRPITMELVVARAHSAVDLLNRTETAQGLAVPGQKYAPVFSVLYDNSVSVVVPSGALRVKFELMPATSDVARHNYAGGGQKVATVYVSSEAREADLVRAVAHELAEIQAIAAGGGGGSALHPGSTSTDLNPHDIGRKAEIGVLSYQAERLPKDQRTEQINELTALLKSLGIEPAEVASERGRKVLGDVEASRLDEILNPVALRERIPRKLWKADDFVDRDSWVFRVDVDVPGVAAKQLPVLATYKLENGQPAKGAQLEFLLNDKVRKNFRDMRLRLEGAEPLTEYAVREATERFRARFKQEPGLGGSMVEDNKANFQRAYGEIRLREPKLSAQEVAQKAVMATAYGRARGAMGYDISVVPSADMTVIIAGDPPRPVEVPASVSANATKRK